MAIEFLADFSRLCGLPLSITQAIIDFGVWGTHDLAMRSPGWHRLCRPVYTSGMRRTVDMPAPIKITEHHLQAAIVQRLRRMGLDVVADMNAARRSLKAASRLKAAGMTAGELDLRIYMPGGRLGMLEVKTDKGRLSDAQAARIEKLRGLGYPVEVVRAATVLEAADLAEAIVREWLNRG